ncbi:CHAT domain-containing protein [Boeremia exigua]|uniref:CHAT domain-containing protein n=1 Tax=Boeremia exigua TaxID=749465 RepID=UPI001E8DCCE4|nr:CHAT domain-containing protein [Boeremia exigua]KAH6611846.1 CHAT domain-containing protein [Boeremia exigua]
MMYFRAIESDVPGLVDLIGDFPSGILIAPLASCIDKRAHVIFVASGVLTRIPFGALKYKGQYLALQKMVSQVPSLRALHFLHQRRSCSPEPRRLRLNAVAQPGAAGNQWLPMAGLDAMRIANIGGSALWTEEVSQQGFRDLIRDSDSLHICTHGRYDADFPFNSHLLLKDPFRVLDMMAVQSEVLLVTFRACLSGVGRASDAGDLQGFSHAVVAAGANCYLGALWEVNDVATMLHMSMFYKCLVQAQLSCTIAFAWGVATNWLYQLSVDQAIEQLRKFMQLWDQWAHNGRKPADLTGKSAKRKLPRVITDWEHGKKVFDSKSPRI